MSPHLLAMENEDARHQTLEQLHERRKQVVAMTGLRYPTVRGVIDRFEAGGWAAVRPALRGRSRGDGRVLSAAQEEAIQRLIIDKRPEQLKMEFSLWSRAAVDYISLTDMVRNFDGGSALIEQ